MINGMTGKLIINNQKELVLKEMINQSLSEKSSSIRENVFKECLERENQATTVVEKGLAFPHAKIGTEIDPSICIGYSPEGIIWDTSGEIVHIIVLLICHEDDHLTILAELASMIQVPGVLEKLEISDSPEAIIQILENARELRTQNFPFEKERLTQAMVKQICTLMNSSGKSRIVLLTNSPSKISDLMKQLDSSGISLVTNKKDLNPRISPIGDNIENIYEVNGNLTDEKSILRELWANEMLKEGEIIISISGFEYQDMPHRISITSIPWDLYNESRILGYQIPHNINLEILSRVIYLSSELASQGREGKPVGTIFVLGDYNKVKAYCKQLIINPFGYLDEQRRNILDPSLSETIKEYSKIDGAFIIGNDGLIHSAGTYLSIPPSKMTLTPGLGARHAAAMGITLVAPVVSAVISESTGNIRVFWDGAEQDKYIPSE